MVTIQNTVITYRYSLNDLIVSPDGTTFHSESNTSCVDLQPSSTELMPLTKGTPIPNSSHTLQHDLLAELHTSQDGYIIRSALIDEDGYGTALNEAYFDFLTSIRDRYNSMKEREPRLSTHELQILHHLRNLLEPH